MEEPSLEQPLLELVEEVDDQLVAVVELSYAELVLFAKNEI